MRRGVALVTTILALVVLGVVIAGVFFGSSQELRMGRNLLDQERAMALAEDGLARLLAEWDGSAAAAMTVGEASTRTLSAQEGATIRSTTTRLTQSSFWLASEALTEAGNGSRRATGVLIRLAIPELGPPAALAIVLPRGDPDIDLLQGSARIDGTDSAPAGWSDCPELGATVPGIITDTLVPSIFDPDEWRALTSRATIFLAGGSVVGTAESPLRPSMRDGLCDRAFEHNWGDPDRTTPCARYFPVVHVAGDLRIAGGMGQGMLLVDGDLMLEGGVRFVGTVLVRGALRTGAGGAHLTGVVRVGGQGMVASVLGDGVEIHFSRCAVAGSLAPGSAPEMVPRSWIHVY